MCSGGELWCALINGLHKKVVDWGGFTIQPLLQDEHASLRFHVEVLGGCSIKPQEIVAHPCIGSCVLVCGGYRQNGGGNGSGLRDSDVVEVLQEDRRVIIDIYHLHRHNHLRPLPCVAVGCPCCKLVGILGLKVQFVLDSDQS